MARSLPGEKISSILVFKQRNIGDVLLATPAVHALRIAWPKARLAVAVNSGTEAMVAGNPDIDRVMVFDRSARDAGGARRWREEVRFLGEIRACRPDLAVQLTEGDRGAILAFLSGARFRIGVASVRDGVLLKERLFTHLAPRPPLVRHTVLKDLDVLAAAGIPPGDLRLRFTFSEEDRQRARQKAREAGLIGDRYAVVHPGSRWKFKCWTTAGMAGVLDVLEDRGIRPLVTGAPDPAEHRIVREILEMRGRGVPTLVGNLTLKELGALLAGARLFVGVDSAPMHLSAAVGTPTLAVFGPSGAFNWAPWEGIDWGYTPERKSGSRFVGKHAVVQKDWDCVPCGKDGCEGTKRSRCLEETTLEEVREALDRVLAGPGTT
ncbi:MAG: lipopolysaccharide heptosyltransferase [Deltaproteobacteria bacterium]|nr:lipopolysaccharide heptosyltransferase [Deltaproteobacteria bacterium]